MLSLDKYLCQRCKKEETARVENLFLFDVLILLFALISIASFPMDIFAISILAANVWTRCAVARASRTHSFLVSNPKLRVSFDIFLT